MENLLLARYYYEHLCFISFIILKNLYVMGTAIIFHMKMRRPSCVHMFAILLGSRSGSGSGKWCGVT